MATARSCSARIRSIPPAASSSSSSSSVPRERRPLGGRLDVDERAVARHDDVEIDVGLGVLGVVEVEQRLPGDDAHRDRRHRAGQRLREPKAVERAMGGHPDAADRRAARPAVRLEHVAVEPERALSERLEVGDGAYGAPDEPLDLDRAASLAARAHLAGGALARGRRQQRVLGGHPALPLAHEPARHALLHRRGAQDLRLALDDEHAAVRLLEVVGDDLEGPEVVGLRPSFLMPRHAPGPRRRRARRRRWAAGGTARPCVRKRSTSPVVRKRYDPSRSEPPSIPFRASVSATSRAVSSAEKTSVTSRPKTRWKIGRMSG